MTLKPGDIVECIERSGNSHLTLGAQYKILSLTDYPSMVRLEEFAHNHDINIFFTSRFKKVDTVIRTEWRAGDYALITEAHSCLQRGDVVQITGVDGGIPWREGNVLARKKILRILPPGEVERVPLGTDLIRVLPGKTSHMSEVNKSAKITLTGVYALKALPVSRERQELEAGIARVRQELNRMESRLRNLT